MLQPVAHFSALSHAQHFSIHLYVASGCLGLMLMCAIGRDIVLALEISPMFFSLRETPFSSSHITLDLHNNNSPVG
jgi:hypothetical protein